MSGAGAIIETPQQADRAETIFEKSVPGRRAAQLPAGQAGDTPIEDLIPRRLLREHPAELPEVSEPEIIRHYKQRGIKLEGLSVVLQGARAMEGSHAGAGYGE